MIARTVWLKNKQYDLLEIEQQSTLETNNQMEYEERNTPKEISIKHLNKKFLTFDAFKQIINMDWYKS